MKQLVLSLVALMVVCSAKAEDKLQCTMWGLAKDSDVVSAKATASLDPLGHAELRGNKAIKSGGFECNVAYVPPDASRTGVIWINFIAPNGMETRLQQEFSTAETGARVELIGTYNNYDHGYCFCKFGKVEEEGN
jgi:hypothetical protein